MGAIRSVDLAEARPLLESGAVLLDVRTDEEWAAGRAPQARHVPLAELPDRVGELDAAALVVCVCRSGGRSGRATAFLAERGVEAANLEGGMIGWAAAGLPLVADGPTAEVL